MARRRLQRRHQQRSARDISIDVAIDSILRSRHLSWTVILKEIVVQSAAREALWNDAPSDGFAMAYPSTEVFTEFARDVGPRLRCALASQLGYERGREATQDAIVWAWEHWDLLAAIDNRAGYLYRVAKRRATRPGQPIPCRAVERCHTDHPDIEPALKQALADLTPRQRSVVFLVEGLGMTYKETAEYLGVTRSTVQSHMERGMGSLRRRLGANDGL